MNKKVSKKPVKKLDRRELRDLLLGHAPKVAHKNVMLFGAEIEIRQPTLGAILEAQEIPDNKERTVGMIIEYAFVPGTDERIFDNADREVILTWPFGDELVKIQMAIAELTGVDISEAEELLHSSPLSKRS